ncbi:hypothetical protein HBI56_038200 [Parastagonospora nodorum]|nr:hypothetical protein HBH56_068600 [Parastagonospora nodorum]KAH3932447.1 hypothetical protein HBH54_079520 [Parastagonospora nodorum]KAH3955195.1 hypothetical protein HBH53_014840 [Parastagonospora nodorum]KAH3986616.1 hypothetical protein HBH52_046000 [Parastagonospora nodorum]KAH3988452.1 hypothetical protein HBH51_003080 [Parastagonospora nodorum]
MLSIVSRQPTGNSFASSSRKDQVTITRAEPLPDTRELWAKHNYRHIMQMTYGDNMQDGMWICCCGAENHITHVTGPHPPQHLTCAKCEHVFCKSCIASPILVPITLKMVALMRILPSYEAQRLRVGQVCEKCGFTHRATGDDVKFVPYCACGAHRKEDWVVFAICSPQGYHFDPIVTSVQIKTKWREAKEEALQMECSQSAPAPAIAPEMGPKCSNSVRKARSNWIWRYRQILAAVE